MSKNKTIYVCSKCGYETARWSGKCPQCNEWNTLEETERVSSSSASSVVKTNTLISGRTLKDVSVEKEDRILSGIGEFDRVMGGGTIADSFNLLMAPPGTGKSTLAIMVAEKIIEKCMKRYDEEF